MLCRPVSLLHAPPGPGRLSFPAQLRQGSPQPEAGLPPSVNLRAQSAGDQQPDGPRPPGRRPRTTGGGSAGTQNAWGTKERREKSPTRTPRTALTEADACARQAAIASQAPSEGRANARREGSREGACDVTKQSGLPVQALKTKSKAKPPSSI